MDEKNFETCMLCSCSFRGYSEQIEKLISVENFRVQPKKISTEISEVSVLYDDLTCAGVTDIYELLKRHPLLKVTGFHEDFSLGEVYVFYSESGSAAIDTKEYAGDFEGHNDCGPGRWAHNHLATDEIKTRFILMSTGSYSYVTYKFPFIKKWNRFDFAIEQNGEMFVDPVKTNLTYYNGEYVDISLISEPNFVIENGILRKYLGSDETVVIPEKVEAIGRHAFFYKEKVRRVNVPEGCKVIEDGAFFGCDALSAINLPNSLEKIGGDALVGLKDVKLSPDNKNFIFEDDVLYDQDKTFAYFCRQEKTGVYTMPSTVRGIAPKLFQNCIGIEEIVVSSQIKRIPWCAFENCSNLRKVHLPAELESIEGWAFNRCNHLEELHIPENVKEIERDTFSNNGFLLFIEGDELKISQYAFGETFYVKSMIVAPKVAISSFPSELKLSAVKGFLYALNKQMTMDETIISEYEKYIKRQKKSYLDKAWHNVDLFRFMLERKILKPEDLKGYEMVRDLPEEILSMIQSFMSTQSGKTKPKNPGSVSELKKVWGYYVLESGTIAIGNYKGMDLDVRVPEKIGNKIVTKIGEQAFNPRRYYLPERSSLQAQVCSNLTSVYIPDGVIEISANAFWGCNKLTIIGHEGSFAEKFAAENKIPFKVEK